MRFPETPIGDLVSKCATWNPKINGSEKFDYIDLSSVDKDEKAITAAEQYTCSDAPSRARQLVEENDVLVATVRPNLNGVAIVGEDHDGMTASTGYCVLRPISGRLNPRFLFHWVKTGMFVQRMVDVATGANYPAVSDAKVKASTLPLPPLTEQKRIAAILDAADDLRAKRRAAIAQLDVFLQSTFIEMFGDPVANPKGWDEVKIADIAKVGTGSTPSRKHEEYFGGDIPWVKSTEVDWKVISATGESVTSKGVISARLKLYPEGSVVLALYGQGKTRGKCAFLGVGAAINQACCAMITNAKCTNIYLFEYLKYSYRRLRGESRGGNQENLNMAIVRSFPIPLPPIDLQNDFRSIVEVVEKQRSRMQAHLAELDALFASLQHRAFNGEL